MRSLHSTIFLIFLTLHGLLLSNCGEKEGRRLPRHSGAPGEILVVMDDKLWLGPEGDSLRKVLEAYVPLLPQAEPRFSLLHFRLDEMSDLLKQHRNILEIEINPQLGPESTGLKLIRDKWSRQQLVFTARAENTAQYYDLIDRQLSKMANIVDETEIERLKGNYAKLHEKDMRDLVRKKFGVDMTLPAETALAKEKNNFLWLKREQVKYKGNMAHELVQGFFIFRYPYSGEDDFDFDALLAARDSVLKQHVPGPDPGTYMTTEYRFEPQSEVITFNERFAVKTKGLWKTENYFMGGPFTSISTTSNDGNYIINISGFVFAPNFQKREYLREVEAVIEAATFLKSES